LIEKYGGDPGIQSVDDLKTRFAYRDFAHFIAVWQWKNKFFRRGEDFEVSAYETLQRLHTQNVVYVEAFFSPWDFADNGVSMHEITEALVSGCSSAERDFGIRWKLIADINREHGPEAGLKRIDEVASYRDRGVIGIGLGGSEHLCPAELFVDVFARAARRGLFLTAHAGEASGAASVRAAVEQLRVQRVGHGVRAFEDPRLVEELAARRIPLEMCITSNVCTGVVPSAAAHPIRRYLQQGVVVTANTDDPTMFGCSLIDEYCVYLREKDRGDV
jgi:adenosine deaminase